MISVIVPVYNGEKYLDECLSNVPISDTEIIVVNDESSDNSEQIARKYTDRVINIKHAGPVVARNVGIENANGEFIVFIDSDDVFTENAFDELTKNIVDNDIVIGLRHDFISPDCTNKSPEIKTSKYAVISGCAMIRKSAFESIGNFDSELLCGDGYDWLLRAEKAGLKIKKIDSVLCMRRIHNSNMGRTMQNREYSDYCKIIRKHFVGK